MCSEIARHVIEQSLEKSSSETGSAFLSLKPSRAEKRTPTPLDVSASQITGTSSRLNKSLLPRAKSLPDVQTWILDNRDFSYFHETAGDNNPEVPSTVRQ
ncbi:hypothetical protein ACU8KH_04638 [Lachancea thermotolerans]